MLGYLTSKYTKAQGILIERLLFFIRKSAEPLKNANVNTPDNN